MLVVPEDHHWLWCSPPGATGSISYSGFSLAQIGDTMGRIGGRPSPNDAPEVKASARRKGVGGTVERVLS
jgi:hypothetical protein